MRSGNLRPRRLAARLAGVSLAFLSQAAQAAPVLCAFDLANEHLLCFDAATPGVLIDDLTLAGIQPFESLAGIDVRPATGELYAVAVDAANSAHLVTIDLATGAVTSVGTTPFTAGLHAGLAFDPVVDQLRMVTEDDVNLRVNPDTGVLVATDTSLAYVAGDVAFGNSPKITHVAYTNSFAGAATTTLFGIDTTNSDVLVRIGGPGGSPSPNTGEVTTISFLLDGGTGVNGNLFGGFDIDPVSGKAYAALNLSNTPRLYEIDLATGGATLIGTLGAGGFVVDGLTVVPENASGSTGLGAVLALAGWRSARGRSRERRAPGRARWSAGLT
jgi:hypothetical protein